MKIQSLWSLVIVTSLILLTLVVVTPSRTLADAITCQPETIPVHLSAIDPTTYNIAGKLCWQGDLAGKTMQVLISGYTYDHNYWDFPYQQPTYSYVTSAVQAGYATLAIDRIGTGQSDRPLPELVNVISEGYTLHNIVQSLRNGNLENTAFPKIVLVGHSLGTLIAWTEAATYQDVDGVIASGWLHVFNPVAAANIIASTYPALLDPKFAGNGLLPGYVTTKPGTRAGLFYNTADADPQVISLDETLKQTGTDGEEATFGPSDDPLVTLQIHVPVLSVVGQSDSIFCQPLLLPCSSDSVVVNREKLFYNPYACLEAYTLPGSGHDLNLHLNASSWFTAANNWVAKRVGSTATTPPSQPCL